MKLSNKLSLLALLALMSCAESVVEPSSLVEPDETEKISAVVEDSNRVVGENADKYISETDGIVQALGTVEEIEGLKVIIVVDGDRFLIELPKDNMLTVGDEIVFTGTFLGSVGELNKVAIQKIEDKEKNILFEHVKEGKEEIFSDSTISITTVTLKAQLEEFEGEYPIMRADGIKFYLKDVPKELLEQFIVYEVEGDLIDIDDATKKIIVKKITDDAGEMIFEAKEKEEVKYEEIELESTIEFKDGLTIVTVDDVQYKLIGISDYHVDLGQKVVVKGKTAGQYKNYTMISVSEILAADGEKIYPTEKKEDVEYKDVSLEGIIDFVDGLTILTDDEGQYKLVGITENHVTAGQKVIVKGKTAGNYKDYTMITVEKILNDNEEKIYPIEEDVTVTEIKGYASYQQLEGGFWGFYDLEQKQYDLILTEEQAKTMVEGEKYVLVGEVVDGASIHMWGTMFKVKSINLQ